MTLSNAELYRLKSDARRGLLENDLMDLLIGRKDTVAALKECADTDSFKRLMLKLKEK